MSWRMRKQMWIIDTKAKAKAKENKRIANGRNYNNVVRNGKARERRSREGTKKGQNICVE